MAHERITFDDVIRRTREILNPPQQVRPSTPRLLPKVRNPFDRKGNGTANR